MFFISKKSEARVLKKVVLKKKSVYGPNVIVNVIENLQAIDVLNKAKKEH